MNEHSKENNNQPDKNTDEMIDSVIKNAKIRRELSEAEMEKLAGGTTWVTTGRRAV